MECGKVGEHYDNPYVHSRPTLLKWPCQDKHVSGSIASAPGVGHFRSCWHKWGMAASAACEFGAEDQTLDHVFFRCPIHRPPHGLHGRTVLNDERIEWLLNTCPDI